MTKPKEFIDAHDTGIMAVITGTVYLASIIASVWFIRDYVRISKAVKEIYRIQREVHPFNR